MIKKIRYYCLLLALLPIWALSEQLLLKDTAPKIYIVKQGDTLWDISNMYLNKPWYWPQIWRTNAQITNPHLIYPGDELKLSINAQGQPVIDIVRAKQKKVIRLSPQGKKTVKATNPISVLPWGIIQPYIDNDFLLSHQEYDNQPYILGNDNGSVYFATNNFVLGKGQDIAPGDYQVVRQQGAVYGLDGEFLGLQVRHIADAVALQTSLTGQTLLDIKKANQEVKRGDKLVLSTIKSAVPKTISIKAAAGQQGYIVGDLENHELFGKYNVVVLDLGEQAVEVGTIMGIYTQGPKIFAGDPPQYEGESSALSHFLFRDGDIQQPAFKVGELLIFKVFAKASYALITRSTKIIRKGAIVAKP
ncbi:MAG: hypothetical protein ACI88A_003260 [Paraglaciecola sp.]|jgi:hypothetical protein